MTIAEFDAFVDRRADDVDYELIDGTVFAMSNPTQPHERIASNIGSKLTAAMDQRGCDTFQGGMRVQHSVRRRGKNKYRPDVVVRCGPMSVESFITDPVVAIEVLSPTTIDVDRGPKLKFYKTLPSIQHIVLVYQDEMRVEHYWRTDKVFELEVLKSPSDILRLATIEFEIALERVYFRVDVG
jgi:Uma2 family endonuclease